MNHKRSYRRPGQGAVGLYSNAVALVKDVPRHAFGVPVVFWERRCVSPSPAPPLATPCLGSRADTSAARWETLTNSVTIPGAVCALMAGSPWARSRIERPRVAACRRKGPYGLLTPNLY